MAERTVLVRLKAVNDAYRKAMREASEDTTTLSKNIKGLQAAAGDIKDIGSKMTRNLTLPIAGTSVVAEKLGVDFDTAFSRMVGLANVPRSEIDGLKQSVLDLAHETGRAPQDLAEALYFIRSSGISASNSLDVLRASARASASGLGSTADIAKAVGFAINAYGENNLSASKATDILTAAVREGSIEADALAPVLGSIIPTASALGISFEQVAGTLAVMSRTGTDAAEGATGLSAVMSTLMGTSKEGAAMLESHGLSLKKLRDMASGPGGLIAVFRTLNDTFHGDEEAISTIIPNIRALRVFMTALSQDGSDVDNVLNNVANSAGAANEAFDAWASSKGAQFDRLFSDAKAALIRFSDTISPLITALTALGGAGVSAFGALPGWGQKGAASILLIVAAIGPLLSIVGTLGTNLKAMGSIAVKAFQLIQTGALNAVGSLGAIGLAAAAVVAVLGVIAFKWWQNEQAAKAAKEQAVEWAAAINDANGNTIDAITKRLDDMFKAGKADNLMDGLLGAGIGLNEFAAAVAAGGEQLDNLKVRMNEVQLQKTMSEENIRIIANAGVSVHDLAVGLAAGKNAMDATGSAWGTLTGGAQNSITAVQGLDRSIDGLSTGVVAGSARYDKFNQLVGESGGSANAAEARLLGLTGGVESVAASAVDADANLKAMLATLDAIYDKAFGVLDANLDYADALDQVGKSSDTASGSTRNLAQEEHDAAKAVEAVTKAQQDLADAEAKLVEARKGPSARDQHDAALDVKEAQLGLADAQKAVADAQKKITEERKKGRDGDVKGATLDLAKAQLGLQRAQDRVTDAQAAQNDVLRSGEEASQKVKDAVAAVTDAQDRLADAQFAQTQQQDKAVAGTGRVIDKQKELGDQIDDVISKAKTLNETMVKMGTPQGEVLSSIATQAAAVQGLIDKYGDVNGKLHTQLEYLLNIAIAQGLPLTVNPESGLLYYELPKPKAAGGPVSAGMPYLVGERGPELMVPNGSGRIIPNHQLTSASSYSGAARLPSINPSEVVVEWDGHKVGTAVVQWSWDIGGAEFKVKKR